MGPSRSTSLYHTYHYIFRAAVVLLGPPVNLVALAQIFEYWQTDTLAIFFRSSVFMSLSAGVYTYTVSEKLQKQMQINKTRRWVAIAHVLRLRAGEVAPADCLLLVSRTPVLVDELELTGRCASTTALCSHLRRVAWQPLARSRPGTGGQPLAGSRTTG